MKAKLPRCRLSAYRFAIIGCIGSLCALALAFSGYPGMVFGTGKLASIMWYSALGLGILFTLILLGGALRGIWSQIITRPKVIDAMFAVVMLGGVLFAWRLFFSFLGRMP